MDETTAERLTRIHALTARLSRETLLAALTGGLDEQKRLDMVHDAQRIIEQLSALGGG